MVIRLTVSVFSQLAKHFLRSPDRSYKNLSQGKAAGGLVQLKRKGSQAWKVYLMFPSAAVIVKIFSLMNQTF